MLQVKKSSFCGVSFFYEWNTSPDNSFQFFWVFSKNNFLGRGFLVSMGGDVFQLGDPSLLSGGETPWGHRFWWERGFPQKMEKPVKLCHFHQCRWMHKDTRPLVKATCFSTLYAEKICLGKIDKIWIGFLAAECELCCWCLGWKNFILQHQINKLTENQKPRK